MGRDGYRDRVAALCARFGYPAPVREALERTCRELLRLEPRAILLVGSAARGELTFRPAGDGRLEMFSDLELFCLLERNGAGPVEEVQRDVARLESELFLPNGLFHLDCLVTREVPGGATGRGLLWYEGGRTFQVLYGPEEPYFGQVEPSAVSLETINELVIIRLWWLLVHFPSWLLQEGEGERGLAGPARDAFVYTQVRNLLDVLSIWLPNEGVYECGYRARLQYVQEHLGDLLGAEYLPERFVEDAAEATRRKLECDLDADPVRWYQRVIGAYEGLVGFLLDVPRPAQRAELLEAVRRSWGERHRVPRSWRFRAYAAALVARSALQRGAGAEWLRRCGSAEAAALEFLLAMHRAAASHLRGDRAEAEQRLAAAESALWRFSGAKVVPPAGGTTFAKQWHDLRTGFIGPFTRYYRKVGGKRAAVESRIKMDEERLVR